MTASKSQSDSARDKTASVSQPENTRQPNAPVTPSARDNGRVHTQLPRDAGAPSNNGRHKATPKRRIEDHPAWSAYLASRHILEPAIAAGAWVEREQWTGQNVLVWRARRRDGRLGATRRLLLKKVKIRGKKQSKVRWQVAGEKTDEPFYYVGTLEDLKREIARAGGKVYIVEGAFGVWSLHRLGIRNVIGIYGISNIPKDMGAILSEIGAASFVYLADNDSAGEEGGSNLRALLHGSEWKGEEEYRRVAGWGIPDKGDANDLLRYFFPAISLACLILNTLPRFQPRLKREPVAKPLAPLDSNKAGWKAVNEANRIAMGVTRFKANGFSENRSCPNEDHEDKTPSAALHKDGFCTCQVCGTFNSKQLAELQGVDWRAILRSQRQIAPSKAIDLDAASQAPAASLAFDIAPDSWLRSMIKFYKPTEAVLFHYASRFCQVGPLAQGFTRDEFIQATRALGCKMKADTIKKTFKKEVFDDDNHAIFAKVDPKDGSSIRKCKFRLRELDDIQRRLLQGISYRVFEKTFSQHDDTLIQFKAFEEALPGSEFAKTLKSALEPLYREQKQRFASLKHFCERKIAAYEAELQDLSATLLPDWTIDKPCDLPALLARGIYDADPQDRSKREWMRSLGISKTSVDAVLQRAGIQRHAFITKANVDSQREAKDRARELGAKIVAVQTDGAHMPYDTAMEIKEGSVAVLQPTARHEIVSDDKQVIKAPATSAATPAGETETARADNMEKPGNWTKASWDPQFIYWELAKACCLLHGYEIIDAVGICDRETGEVWTNPTLDEVVGLITGELPAAEPDPG